MIFWFRVYLRFPKQTDLINQIYTGELALTRCAFGQMDENYRVIIQIAFDA